MPSCVVPWLNSVCPRLSTRRRPWLSTSSRSRDDSAWNSGGGPASSALLSLNTSACQAPAWDISDTTRSERVAEAAKRRTLGEALRGRFEHRQHRAMRVGIDLAGNFFAVGGEPMLA